MKTPELGGKLFDNRLHVLVDLWKEKYAKKRINNLISKERTNFTSLFYDDIIKLSWKETKEKHI